MTGEEVIRYVRERTDTVVLSFSGGKDAVAMWLRVRGKFPRIVPIYFYALPGLSFVERALTYYEDYFGERIVRLPQPGLYQTLEVGTFQSPAQRLVTARCGIESFTRADAMRAALEDRGIDADSSWTLVGIRAADSLQRRQAMLTTGGVNARRRIAYPVWDWRKDDLLRVFRESGVQLAPDYRVWGQTFDGIDERFMGGLREHYPEDHERVRALYGAVDADRARWRFGHATQA